MSEKEPSFGVHKVNGGQDICSRVASVESWKNLEKQVQCSKWDKQTSVRDSIN